VLLELTFTYILYYPVFYNLAHSLIPQDTEAGEVTFTITGGVRAPYYKSGETTVDEWLATRNSVVPWAEIGSSKYVTPSCTHMYTFMDLYNPCWNYWSVVFKRYG
jgi:hypothetical protein